MDIRANGLRFHAIDEGTGTPVLLLHGFPDIAANFSAAQRNNERRLRLRSWLASLMESGKEPTNVSQNF